MAGLIIIFLFITMIVILIILGLLLYWFFFERNTPASAKDVSSSPKNTLSKDIQPPPPKTPHDSENVLLEDVNKISSIQISSDLQYLAPGEERIFKVKATNKMGSEINPSLIQWQATGGEIDSQGRLIVDPRSKGTFNVTAISHVDNLKCSINYTVLPKLTNVEIITTKEIVMPGQDVYLELRGTDQTQAEINVEGQPIWSTTTGTISSNNKLVVDLPNRIVYITAKISGLEAKNTIRVGERPQKVVEPIYPIDISNSSSETTPTQDKISIPIASDHYPEDELPKHEPKPIKESSRLISLEIDAPDLIFLKPSQERVFIVRGIDQFGEYINPGGILWKATGGTIDSQGKLIVDNDAKGSFRVTAISSNAKVSQNRLRQRLLLIKISLKIFSWVLSHKRFAKDTASYFIQDFFDTETFVNKIFPAIDTSNIDGILTVLVLDDIKDWVIEAVINIIIDYLDKFISLCFVEDFDSLICYKSYIVLPELKSQESLVSQRMKSPLLIQNPPSRTNIRQDIYLSEPCCNNILPELRRIRIVSYHKKINPVKIVQFQLLGIDRSGKDISINAPIIWKTTDGQISSTGQLIVNNLNNTVQITATVGQLEAKTDMRHYRRHYTDCDTFTEYY